MAFRDFSRQQQGIELLQRSLERGRLAHGYLFSGHQLEELESLGKTLAKTLNCLQPVRHGSVAVDCCDECLACRKIEHGNHADVHWVRPESKSRVVTIDQMRGLMREIQLKPTEAKVKVAVVVAADRLRIEAANAFLKTLEEPPPGSVLILLTTEPQRILETILSRCLRLSFSGGGPRQLNPEQLTWLTEFSAMASAPGKSLLGRYRLLDVLLRRLTAMKAAIDESLTERSPIQKYPDAEKETISRWEDELAAAIEAEYRRQRADLLSLVQWWLRDVWLWALRLHGGYGQPEAGANATAATELISFPEVKGAHEVASRISAAEATENLEILEQLQRRLWTNVQEALTLEVSLLKLHL